MSSRNFRKICGTDLPPPPDSDDSDFEFDPPMNRRSTFTYEGLQLSTTSESESQVSEESESDDAVAQNVAVCGGARKKKKNGKASKGKGKKPKFTTGAEPRYGTEGLQMSSVSESGSQVSEEPETDDNAVAQTDVCGGARKKNKNGKGNKGKGKKAKHAPCAESRRGNEELDEIDISVMEVNALLGEPLPAPAATAPAATVTNTKLDKMNLILTRQAKHLNVAYEIRRIFGPEDAEEIRDRHKTQPNRVRLLKRVLVRPTNDAPIYGFVKTGLSMCLEKRDGDILYFMYNHDLDHQKMHHAFLIKYSANLSRPATELVDMDEARKYMHVEPLLEIADTLFRIDESNLANEIIENVVTYLQYVAHPFFDLASTNVRLSYKYLENRPFHVAMLKYVYLLTNKAYHRTALEIAKMLMNIDPSDPLAVLFIIDTLAIRSREYQWLIDAVDYLTEERNANILVNIKYSYALAHFHIATKNKSDLSLANKHLSDAIMWYPGTVLKILEFNSMVKTSIQSHSFFNNVSSGSEILKELITIYAKLTSSRWREKDVKDWLFKVAMEVCESYTNSEEIRNQVKHYEFVNNKVFQVPPIEIMRHFTVIRPMANLILEMTLRPATHPTSSWDPVLDRGYNRYSYRDPTNNARTLMTGNRPLLLDFFYSIMPNTNLDPPVDD